MHSIYDHNAPKKPANLTVNSDLLRKAREHGINLSAVLESTLEEMLRRQLAEQWLAENHEAIPNYNAHVDAHGVFSDGIRSF